ncbi:hypothetical protein IE077_003415, partial [Cardiosporidium cionae]
ERNKRYKDLATVAGLISGGQGTFSTAMAAKEMEEDGYQQKQNYEEKDETHPFKDSELEEDEENNEEASDDEEEEEEISSDQLHQKITLLSKNFDAEETSRIASSSSPLLSSTIEVSPLSSDGMWASKRMIFTALQRMMRPLPWYQFVQDISFCPITWKLNLKFGWPKVKCPYRIDFLSTLVDVLKGIVLQDTPSVANPRIVTGENSMTGSPYELQCEGSDFGWIHQLKASCIDQNRVVSNDIKSVLKYYGIEAARTCIIKELKKVFSVYGIEVNYRHLSLLSDYMTHSGNYCAFNRSGLSYNNSPLLQMSFETSMKFLTAACERGAYDNLRSPAGAIVAGRSPYVGTGISRILSSLTNGKAAATTLSKAMQVSASTTKRKGKSSHNTTASSKMTSISEGPQPAEEVEHVEGATQIRKRRKFKFR